MRCAIQHQPCVDASKGQVVKGCSCLMELLETESNKEIAPDLVCFNYNMEFHARNLILTEKIRKVTEQKLLKRKKRKDRKTNELFLRGRIFDLNFGLGNEVSSRDIVSLYHHSFQRLFAIGYKKIDNIKNNYITNTDYSHGLKIN